MLEYAQFKSILQTIKSREEMVEALNNVFRKYTYQVDFISGDIFIDDKLVDIILGLLEQMYHDEDNWISYWAYQLNWGESWQPGMITDKQGDDIPLGTIEDLWNLLMTNMVDGEL